MELIGRLTSPAWINELKDGRKVVNFNIAINDYYKTKDSEELKKETLFVGCSYWINTKVAERLTKGCLVEIYGRLRLNAYKNVDDEAKAYLNCHVNHIKIYGGKPAAKATAGAETANTGEKDDLPF